MAELSSKQKAIEYVSITAPLLKKYASDKEQFMNGLNHKLNGCVKAGTMTQVEADQIKKQASENPASVFQFFDVPAYNSSVGKVTKQASHHSSGSGQDALAQLYGK